MKIKDTIVLVTIFLCLCFTFTSCSSHHHSGYYSSSKNKRGNGPPPHAPAHGYRHKHQHGTQLVYNSELGVYVVIDFPNHYFYEGHYFRLGGKNWEISTHINGPWIVAANDVLPCGLKVKGKYKSKGKHKVKVYVKWNGQINWWGSIFLICFYIGWFVRIPHNFLLKMKGENGKSNSV